MSAFAEVSLDVPIIGPTGPDLSQRAQMQMADDAEAKGSPRLNYGCNALVLVLLVGAVIVFFAAPAQADQAHVFETSFGSAGSGAGELSLAANSGLAINEETHNLYLADTQNHRVDEFSSGGVFIRAFGADVGGPGVGVCTSSCVAGSASSAAGGFESPVLVAVDNSTGPSQGDVYVGDLGDNLVSKFDSQGNLIAAWGAGGQLAAFESGLSLKGVAVGPSGDLFITDNNGRAHWYLQDGSRHEPSIFFTPRGAGPAGLAVDTEETFYNLAPEGAVIAFTSVPGSGWTEPDVHTGAVALAVDPSDNDLYAVHGNGSFVSRTPPGCGYRCPSLEEFGGAELTNPQGIAVDSTSHAVYVADSAASNISVFTLQTVEPPTAAIGAASEIGYTSARVSGTVNPHGHATTCAFEYVSAEHFQSEGFTHAQAQPCTAQPGSGSINVAVEAQLSHLAASTTYHVRLVAMQPGNLGNTVYTPEPNLSFDTEVISMPTVSIATPTGVAATSAHFSGEINPNAPGPEPQDPAFDVAWHFECTPECPGLSDAGGEIAADDSSHEVDAEATGLLPGTSYEVRLIAKNSGPPTAAGPVHFTTVAVPPAISLTSVLAADLTEATLSAQVNPGGAPTTFHFEYLTEAAYEANLANSLEGFAGASSTPESAPIGSDDVGHEASSTVTDLLPETSYRFRAVATNNSAGNPVIDGPAESFYTYSAAPASSGCGNEQLRAEDSSLRLPDCRAYEQVSPAGNSEVFEPSPPFVIEEQGMSRSELPMQVSADGSAVTYVSEPLGSGQGEGTGNAGNGEGDQFFASRGPGGWAASDIEPRGTRPSTSYEGFSDDLSLGVIAAGRDEAVSEGLSSECPLLYSGRSGAFRSLYPSLTATECKGQKPPFFVGASADSSHVLFESNLALTPGAKKTSGEFGHENIYVSVEGEPFLVNILPGSKADPNATVGSINDEDGVQIGSGNEPALNTSGVISTDGSRIFWTNLTTGIIYVRENATKEPSAETAGHCTEAQLACTVKVSAGSATYQAATPDGRYAYYTEAGELWRFDTQEGTREALAAGSNAKVLGVIGVNGSGEDGSYLYFVAEGALTPDSEARSCTPADGTPLETREEEEGLAPPGRGCNLYVSNGGTTSFIAALLPGDNDFQRNSRQTGPFSGDWRPVLGSRTAQVSPDGRHLVFMSERRLTSYDNVNRENNCGSRVHSCSEIYLYDAVAEEISCASCNPTGRAPITGVAQNVRGQQTYLPRDFASITHMRRWVSADGSRVFFDTDQSLSRADANLLPDVYEWERAGAGSCAKGSVFNNGGCVYLLSGGTSGISAALVDADEAGENVFFVTRAKLVSTDGDGKPDLYDARVGGGLAVPTETLPCEVEACKRPTPSPPPLPSFGSAHFEGPGNPKPKHHKRHRRRHHHHRRAGHKHRGHR